MTVFNDANDLFDNADLGAEWEEAYIDYIDTLDDVTIERLRTEGGIIFSEYDPRSYLPLTFDVVFGDPVLTETRDQISGAPNNTARLWVYPLVTPEQVRRKLKHESDDAKNGFLSRISDNEFSLAARARKKAASLLHGIE